MYVGGAHLPQQAQTHVGGARGTVKGSSMGERVDIRGREGGGERGKEEKRRERESRDRKRSREIKLEMTNNKRERERKERNGGWERGGEREGWRELGGRRDKEKLREGK